MMLHLVHRSNQILLILEHKIDKIVRVKKDENKISRVTIEV